MIPISHKIQKQIGLLQDKKHRVTTELFVIEGFKMIKECQKAGLRPEYLLIREDINKEHLPAFESEYYSCSKQIFDKLSSLKNAQGVLAVVPQAKVQDTTNEISELVLALDSIQDPGNLGTILRTAAWFGIKKIICGKGTADVYNPKTLQASMGAIFQTLCLYVDLAEWLSIQDKTIPVYGAFLDGENLYNSSLKNPAILVMGNEANGISENVSRFITQRLHIPHFASLTQAPESLNVANATAILCAEFKRQQYAR